MDITVCNKQILDLRTTIRLEQQFNFAPHIRYKKIELARYVLQFAFNADSLYLPSNSGASAAYCIADVIPPL